MGIIIFLIVTLSAIAVWLFQYMNQKRRIRQEEMHQRKRQQFEELLRLVGNKNIADGEQNELLSARKDSFGDMTADERSPERS